MIDTVRFKVALDLKMVQRIRNRSIEMQQTDHENDRQLFRILKNNAPIGSYDRHVNIFVNDDFELFLEFSVPKFALGHNIYMVYPEHVKDVVDDVQRKLAAYFGDFPATLFWELERIDLCYAWKLSNHAEALNVMTMLQKLEMPKKKKYQYDTSLMFKGASFSVKFYLKDDEFYAHDFKEFRKTGKLELAYELYEKSQGVLRFEVTLRKIAINRLFFGAERGTVYLSSDWLTSQKCGSVMRKFLKDVLRVESKFVTLDQVFQILQKFYGKTRGLHLYGFYKIYFHEPNGKTKVLEAMTRQQIWYNLKKIRDAGVGISIEDLPLNLDLDIPSDYAVS